MNPSSWYVGCACDRNYVEHTAAMLTSLDTNGRIPEAQVLVAGFDLNASDRVMLQAGAGRLANRMRIVNVSPAMLAGLGEQTWTEKFPPAVIGRLFLPEFIDQPGARLVTIDSDMIVNVSLRPLLGMRMFGSYVAACHDVPRHQDLNYFNSGLMLIDVDLYKKFDVTRRSLEWLRSQTGKVTFPDQDALNEIVGHIWYRLDHRWNLHCNYGEERAVTPADYERAFIAHFAANKPWNNPTHPGMPLYRRYRDELDQQLALQRRLANKSDAAFVSLAYQVLLGRLPVNAEEYAAFDALDAKEVVTSLVKSKEFFESVLIPIIHAEAIEKSRFGGVPTDLHRIWAKQRLNLSLKTLQRIDDCNDWRSLLRLILKDQDFRKWSSNVHLMELADAIEQRNVIRFGSSVNTKPHQDSAS